MHWPEEHDKQRSTKHYTEN